MLRILGIFILVGFVSLSGCKEKTKVSTNPEKNSNEGKGKAPPEENGATPPGGGKPLTPKNTKIEWTGTKPEGKHVGGFNKFSGKIGPLQDDFTANTITLEIETESLFSDVPKLTNHLKSPDFFDVNKFPKASFTSTAIKESKSGDNTHEISGDLTLHGTTKSITFPAKITQTNYTLDIDSTFTFDRTDFGIGANQNRVDKMVTVKVSSKLSRK